MLLSTCKEWLDTSLMRLLTFRIRNCFGFGDSNDVDLQTSSVIMVLGRNSSGKTSLLQALNHLEWGRTPEKYPNAVNFNASQVEPRLSALYSAPPGQLGVEALREQLIKRLDLLPKELRDEVAIPKCIDPLMAALSAFEEEVNQAGEVTVEKSLDGAYRYLLGAEAIDQLSAPIRAVFKEFQRHPLKVGNQQYEHQLSAEAVLTDLFTLFPQIDFFGDNYPLRENLPDRLIDVLGPSLLEKRFRALLGVEGLAEYFRSEDPELRERLLADFRSRLDSFAASIHSPAAAGIEAPGLIRFRLHEKGGLQLNVLVDGKPSFYRQISENTKLLIAYYLFGVGKDGPRERVLLFDEPSNGLHPSAQEYLARFLGSLVESGNQVICSTHSEYLLSLDDLPGIRVLHRDSAGRPCVSNHPYQSLGTTDGQEALRPLYDAIGLRWGAGLRAARSMVLLEGISDLLYLRAFGRVLAPGADLPLLPTRGDATCDLMARYLIGQGVGVRFLLDTGDVAKRLRREWNLSEGHLRLVPVAPGFEGQFRTSGIEDLFSPTDFRMLAQRAEIPLGSDKKPNSQLIPDRAKRLLAQYALEHCSELETLLSQETLDRFRAMVEFCRSEDWFHY